MDLNKPLRDVTKKETAFRWEAHHSAAVDKLKNALTTAPTLAYFDTNAPVTIQPDASDLGLGVASCNMADLFPMHHDHSQMQNTINLLWGKNYWL